ncbi:thioredoxin domain-containing protein [Corynebacterium breve]|uniref:Thioredoxin domain-containing protein n=1 Tax=Corynebacterium breve TaxID=3049799 RepID=A0ABY8VFF1_9CORY|nr:thioredoxin domain-containing protein [Corynebacterium breve]WIM68233.1 thioredoxin domain-containing protein [Corynebacterium breve]
MTSSSPKQSVLAAVPKTTWIFVAVIAIMALVIGFLIADRKEEPVPVTKVAAPSSTSNEAEPGTDFTVPAAGEGDAFMFGPREEITSDTDIDKVYRRNSADPFAIGAVDAPVVIAEFSDFECPFCSRHTNQTHPELIEKYVDTGLVRIEWNDMPINGPNSEKAAAAGRAAAAQGKFQEFKQALFGASEGEEGHPGYEIENFVDFARQAGVPDLARFEQEVTNGTYTEAVTEARNYGAQIGVNGTPGFFVGKGFVAGAQPIEIFDEAIQDALTDNYGNE